MQRKNSDLHYVFDFDGTIAENGVISKKNLLLLKKFENKVLNTSRDFSEIPDQAKRVFKKIMTLNGSKYYENGILLKTFDKITKENINEIIKICKNQKYNISFNSTNRWQNVTKIESRNFLEKNNIVFKANISDIPKEIFLIAVGTNDQITEELFKNISINFHKQSKRMFEFSKNTKSNISKLYSRYIAFGDNQNDIPMFEKAESYYIVNKFDFEKSVKEFNEKK